jgi:uncharacterized protein (TIGR03435 family)
LSVRRASAIFVGASLILVGAVLPLAQTRVGPATSDGPVFDAASIRSNRSGDARSGFETPPGRLSATNVPLRFVIRRAYRIPDTQIIGGPEWLHTDRFNIEATSPGEGSTPDRTRQLLRALLRDRFKLTTHTETREMPIYALVRPGGGKLGANMRPSATDCTGGPKTANGRVECGLMISQGPASASLRGGGTSLAELVRAMGEFLDRPLVDRTGLTGTFDVELQFTADRGAMPGAGTPGGLTTDAAVGDIPSIFTAVREQLGLALDPGRGRVDVLVIDSVSRPVED